MLTLLVKEVIYMNKIKSTAMLVAITALFILYIAMPAYAGTNSISANPGLISIGGTTLITVTTDKAVVNGRVYVTMPDGVTVWANQVASNIIIGAGGGSQSITFPTDFEAGANTNSVGNYAVETNLNWVAGGTFKVEFFVYPEMPLGAVTALAACFAGLASYKKLKK